MPTHPDPPPDTPCLSVNVYRSNFGDCTNGGATSESHGANRAFVYGEGITGPHRLAELPMAAVLLRLERRQIHGSDHMRAVPEGLTGHSMFGGNFVWSSDSRFRDVHEYPVPVHDRVEG